MGRAVNVLLAPPFAPAALRGAHVVVVDVLRATTTIATALANGAAGVIPASDTETALAIAGRLGRDRVLLCGERDSLRIPGFDLDNSPASYGAETVRGKILVFTTTNGTRALRAGDGASSSVRAAAFVNRAAVADALAREDGAIAILCAGVQGAFALEDALGAGALVDALLERVPGLEVHDGARGAALLYRAVASRLLDAIASADHAAELAAKGFSADLETCARLDALGVVPMLREGMLVVEGAAATAAVPRDGEQDVAARLAARLEETLPGFRERHAGEYLVRGGVNGALLAGALHAYVAVAFRERRGDEALREMTAAFEDVLQAGSPGATALVETFLEGAVEWPWAWQDALGRRLGPAGTRLLTAIGGDARRAASVRE
jgi:2-phosphosulfolactate phosphatase